MNLKKIVTGVLFAFVLMAAGSITAFASSPKGSFETTDETGIQGWAYDGDSLDKTLKVHISIKNTETGEEVFSQWILADEYRESLQDKGNGCHGFTVNVDWNSYPYGSYEIEGMVSGKSFFNTKTYSHIDPEADKKAANEAAPSLVSLGVFKTTGYCPCKSCSGGWGRHTSTGATATAGRTIAVDPRVIPYGSKIMINGNIYIAEDKGGGVKGKHIDIFYDSHAQSKQHGVQHTEVFLVQA